MHLVHLFNVHVLEELHLLTALRSSSSVASSATTASTSQEEGLHAALFFTTSASDVAVYVGSMFTELPRVGQVAGKSWSGSCADGDPLESEAHLF